MSDTNRTTLAVQLYLRELKDADARPEAEPLVRALLARAVNRLRGLCAATLHRHYARLTRGPANVDSDELLSAVVERLMRAMREVRPATVRDFFALANRHMRWELNDLARRLDEQDYPVEATEALAAPEPMSDADDARGVVKILTAIENLPEEEREVLNLVRIQGMSHPEAAAVIGCSEKTIQRRLNRSLVLLSKSLHGPGVTIDGTDAQVST